MRPGQRSWSRATTTRLSLKEPPRSRDKGQSSLGAKLIPREAENFQDLKSKLLTFNIYSFSFSLLSPFTTSSKKKLGNPFDIWPEIFLARSHRSLATFSTFHTTAGGSVAKHSATTPQKSPLVHFPITRSSLFFKPSLAGFSRFRC